jgi:hypothetical protein
VFLYIDGAFDNTSFGSMDAASGEHGFVLTLRRWIDAMLRCRRVRVEIRGSSVRVFVNWGCPQGGVLSPLRRLCNAHYQEHGYADDVVLLQKSKFVSMLCDRCMQVVLNCVENWCREIGLSVNAHNTTMFLFTNNRKMGGFYNPKLFGTELRMTDQVKYLGVILDKKPDWKAHLETKLALHIGSVVVLWKRLGDYHRRWWPCYTLPWYGGREWS